MRDAQCLINHAGLIFAFVTNTFEGDNITVGQIAPYTEQSADRERDEPPGRNR